MAIYLEKEEINDAYYEADKASADWFLPFDEYERIAANKLSKTLGKNMPKVNDGSLAASLLETPMQVYPSMQTGKFTATDRKEAWINEIANITWKNKIVPNANTQASFFDKEQIALYRALKYGAQPRYNFFVSTDNYTGSDWSLPYVRNVKLEPGKFSADDCDYIFLDVYYTKLQLKRIIERVGKDKESGWDIKALKELADMSMTDKEIKEQNINERDKQVRSSGIKTFICFNRGANAPFYMFSPHLEKGRCIRSWKNPDPTGDLPITMQYCYENLESPYGIGRTELAGPTQNVLDYMTQAHMLATQIGLQPPKKLSGPTDNTNFNSLTFTPDAIWQLGNAQIDVVQTASSVYTQFPANFGLYKSQLQTLQGRTDGSVSAESGNPNFSKTSAGVKQQQERTNSQDNYLRNKADDASAKMAKKMMNVHMAQMTGADVLDIAEDDKERLVKAGYLDDNPMTPEPSANELPIIYEDIKATFNFEYDARPEADDEEKNRWLELIDIATSNPNIIPAMEQSGWRFNLGEAFKKVVNASGTADSEKVLTQISPDEMMQQQMPGQVDPQTGMPMQQPMGEEPMGMPETQDPAMEQEDELQVTMEEYGIDQNTAMAVIQARKQGFDEQEIVQYLQGGANNG
jgi:hypothetical protein